MFGDIVPRSRFEDAIDQGLHTDRLEALPPLGVVDHFDQFPAAPDTAFLGPGRRALLGVRARPVGVSKRQRGLEWAA